MNCFKLMANKVLHLAVKSTVMLLASGEPGRLRDKEEIT